MALEIEKRSAKPRLKCKKRVAAYCRVSVAKDATLHSLAAQVSYYQDYIAKDPDWLFAGIYADEGISGTKTNRPEFNRMIEDCKKGKIDMIITKSISRFARNTTYLLETTRLLKSLNIDVYFEEQRMHSLSSDGELMLSLLAGFAEEEVKSMSKNIRWKVNKFFEEGKVWGIHDFYGYKRNGDTYEVDEGQAEVIRLIYGLYIDEGLGTHQVARRLNGLHIPSPLGFRWQDSVVRRILTNITYTGNLLLGRYSRGINQCDGYKRNNGEYPMYKVEDSHPAIVSLDAFNKAQDRLFIAGNKFRPHSKGSNASIFTGLIRCGSCNKNYIRKRNRHRTYWICNSFNTKACIDCDQSLSLREDTLFDLASEALGVDANKLTRDLLHERLGKIVVHKSKDVDFVFADGSMKTLHFEFKSRRLSWTPEMKEEARRREMERLYGKSSNQN